MNIQVLSDLHLEVKPFTLKVNPAADVLVLAGDIVALKYGCEKIGAVINLIKNVKIPIIYVLGNHECYGFGNIPDACKQLKSLEVAFPNFHFLHNESFIIDDVEFIGTPLWSNFDLAVDKHNFMCRVEYAINDFNQIISGNGRLSAFEMRDMNEVARAFIKNAVSVPNGKKKVVVTHFVPTPQCISPEYKGSPVNPYFVCNCENLMLGVHTWIFGHTHSGWLTYVNDTRLVCNPRGYDKENKEFSSQMIVSV